MVLVRVTFGRVLIRGSRGRSAGRLAFGRAGRGVNKKEKQTRGGPCESANEGQGKAPRDAARFGIPAPRLAAKKDYDDRTSAERGDFET
jgi:hypothetical protein